MTARRLSDDQRAVLALAARGLSVSESAARLGVSSDVVRGDLSAAIAVLGASSKLEAVVRALRSGALTGAISSE